MLAALEKRQHEARPNPSGAGREEEEEQGRGQGQRQEDEVQPQDTPHGIKITEVKKKKLTKFNITETILSVEVRQTAAHSVDEAITNMTLNMEKLLDAVKRSHQPTDKLFMKIHFPLLKDDILIPLMPSHEVTSELIMNKIDSIVQSNKEFILPGQFSVTATRVQKPPVGGGGKKRKIAPKFTFEEWMKSKEESGYTELYKQKQGVHPAGNTLRDVYQTVKHLMNSGHKYRTKQPNDNVGIPQEEHINYTFLGELCRQWYSRKLYVLKCTPTSPADKVVYFHPCTEKDQLFVVADVKDNGETMYYCSKSIMSLTPPKVKYMVCPTCNKISFNGKRTNSNSIACSFCSLVDVNAEESEAKKRSQRLKRLRKRKFHRAYRCGVTFEQSKRSLMTNHANKMICAAVAICQGLNYFVGQSLRASNPKLTVQAIELMEHAGVETLKPTGIAELDRFQAYLANRKVQIHVLYHHMGRRVGYVGRHADLVDVNPKELRHLYLLHKDDHYQFISNVRAFLCEKDYCALCDKTKCTENHSKVYKCPRCKRVEGCSAIQEDDAPMIVCPDCRVVFFSQSCYEAHLKKTMTVIIEPSQELLLATAQNEDDEDDDEEEVESDHEECEDVTGKAPERARELYSVCQRYKQCSKCFKRVDLLLPKNRRVNEGDPWRALSQHLCGERRCLLCQELVGENHLCYIQPLKPVEELSQFQWIVFDLECYAYEVDGVHVVKLVKALHVCELCQDLSASDEECPNYGRRMHTFHKLDDFMKWLLSEDHIDTIVLAHNLRSYDGHFVVKYLANHGYLPEVVMSGGKILQMTLKQLKITFKDTLNFFLASLDNVAKMFGLPMEKTFFPHRFNTVENQGYVGPMPAAEYYAPEYMSEERRKDFYTWYEEVKNDGFDLNEVEDEYCENDVYVLAQACVKYRSTVVESAAIDPIKQCMTLAAVSYRDFTQNHMEKDVIGSIPPNGYRRIANNSKKCAQWFWHLYKKGVIEDWEMFRSFLHPQGERIVHGVSVDGYDPMTATAFQFHGCYFHGCPQCYPSQQMMNRKLQKPMFELYARTVDKDNLLRDKGVKLHVIWEHQFDQEVDVGGFPEFHLVPMEPRDTMFGGRCGPIVLHRQAEADEGICYYDFTSLYPSCQCEPYPIGHPEVFTQTQLMGCDPNDVVRRTNGFIKCKVLPPDGLYLPVLPVRCHGKLMFPLCVKCVEERLQECPHTDEQRMMVGSWCTLELQLALEMGYKIEEVFEVWHYPRVSDTLFKSFILKYFKQKTEYSGWPAGCETEEQKQAYLDEVQRNTGMTLDRENIVKNPARRSCCKMSLNSLWGKFAEHTSIRIQAAFVTMPDDFWRLLLDDSIEISEICIMNDEMLLVYYSTIEADRVENPKRNTLVASWTTSLARTKLYRAMRMLQPEQVLYTDTDSIIFSHKPGQPMLPLGNGLGELTSELDPNDSIQTYVSIAPKAYAYETRQGKTACKFKGIRLNHASQQVVNLESMLNLLQRDDDNGLSVPNPQIVRNKKTFVVRTDTEATKKISFKFDKRVQRGMQTFPYGFFRTGHNN